MVTEDNLQSMRQDNIGSIFVKVFIFRLGFVSFYIYGSALHREIRCSSQLTRFILFLASEKEMKVFSSEIPFSWQTFLLAFLDGAGGQYSECKLAYNT